MFGKGPKTVKGWVRKMETGDGRRKTDLEKMVNGDIDMFTGNEVKKKRRRK